ncbi:MAG: hypothetical protein Q7T20_13725, partial [Saprospiraceae bacterium]|nr:hypothetical protein [Saprospiraceae bacterium]
MKGLSLRVMILTVAMLAGAAQLTAQCSGPMSVGVQGSGSGLTCSVSETHINAQCPGENGSVTITATGGTQPYLMGVGTFSQPVGTQIYTVTDFVGCMSSVSVTITANLRFISCPANQSKNVDPGVCNTSVTLALPTTSGVCGSSILEFRYRTVDAANNPTGPYNAYAPSGNNTVLFDRGKYEVEWRLSDGSGSSVCSFYLTIIDNQAPAIICPANQSITANASCSGKIGDWIA